MKILDHIDCGATSYEEAFEKFGIPNCADEWLKLVCDIAFDYDGYKTVEGLKELIDEMVEYVTHLLSRPLRQGIS